MSYGKAATLLRLAIAASSRVGVTLSDIEAMFECDRRTAQRMTSALCGVFPETERWTDDGRRPRWRLAAEPVRAFLAPTPDELAVLARAIEKLSHEGAESEARTLRGLEAKVLASVPKGARARVEVDEEALLQALGLAARPGPRPAADDEVDGHLATALKARSVVGILYRGWNDPQPRWRRIAPHGLLLGTRRYLVGLDLDRRDGVLRHYRVEDISQVRPGGDGFAVADDFDIGAHARAGFSSYVNDQEVERIVWRFAPEAAARAKRFVFHPEQVAEEEPDGALTVSFRACGLLEMCWHLYAWGDKVEVLEPARLRAMIAGHRRSDFPALP